MMITTLLREARYQQTAKACWRTCRTTLISSKRDVRVDGRKRAGPDDIAAHTANAYARTDRVANARICELVANGISASSAYGSASIFGSVLV